MRILVALFLLLASCGAAAAAQGCGPQNPNCIVSTAPPGTSDNRAASTAFVQQAITGGTSGTPRDLPWYNAGGTGIADSGIPAAPVGGLPLFAAPTATGSGNCLSSGNACTLATACSFVKQIATFIGAAGPINLADGTYSTVVNGALCTIGGNTGGSSSQLISIRGNVSTPTNVILAVPNNTIGILVQDGGEVGVNSLEFTGGNISIGIQSRQFSIADYSAISWGAWGTSGSHVSVSQNSSSNMVGNETILGNFTNSNHWTIASGGSLNIGGVTTIGSAVDWSGGAFLVANGNVYVDLTAWSTTGAGVAGSTGQKASLSGPGYLGTAGNASCNSVLPGNANCSFVFGFQGTAGDGQTGTGLSLAQQAPTVFDPTVGPHTYAGLPGSPTAGQISHIIDGLAANCGDGTCTTPWTTVTGGSGALDLLIGWDGAAWRIFRAAGTQSTTGTGAVVHRVSPSLITPDLGTPSALNLANALGLPVAGGGTGNATAAAHSIPVSEGASAQAAVGPCLTNQVIVGGGAGADPACGSNTAGSQQYLCTITASNSASINNASPTSGSCPINSSFTSYKLVFQNIIPATDSKILEFQIHSASGGAGYKNSGYITSYIVSGNAVANAIGSVTTYIPLSYPADSNNYSLHNVAPGFSGEIIIANPSATAICMIYGQITYLTAGGTSFFGVGQTSGYWNTSAAVDGFQILMDSGNLTSGSILVYGIL